MHTGLSHVFLLSLYLSVYLSALFCLHLFFLPLKITLLISHSLFFYIFSLPALFQKLLVILALSCLDTAMFCNLPGILDPLHILLFFDCFPADDIRDDVEFLSRKVSAYLICSIHLQFDSMPWGSHPSCA